MRLIDVEQPLILTYPAVLTETECQAMIERIEEAGPTVAPITTARGPVMRTDIRNNSRVIFDDPAYATMLFERVRDILPEVVLGRKICGANERLRCYKYQPGQYFAPHADGAFRRDETEVSHYTFMVYLNDDFSGGETTFITEPERIIQPRTGMALFFQHPIIHEGSVVKEGVKYVVRSDIMYRDQQTNT